MFGLFRSLLVKNDQTVGIFKSAWNSKKCKTKMDPKNETEGNC